MCLIPPPPSKSNANDLISGSIVYKHIIIPHNNHPVQRLVTIHRYSWFKMLLSNFLLNTIENYQTVQQKSWPYRP